MILFVFVDGVGAGLDDPDLNPLARHRGLLAHFADGSSAAPLPKGGAVNLIDATLGVDGRPQSATGQTTILTGENAAAHLGRHYVGFPPPPLVTLLQAGTLFSRLDATGARTRFANAYHRRYLEALGLSPRTAPTGDSLVEPPFEVPRQLRKKAATTIAVEAAGHRFSTFDEVLEGTALFHDITHRRAREFGTPVDLLDPAEAGRRLLTLAREQDFTLFEYFLTDKAGHARDFEAAALALEDLENFLQAILAGLDPETEGLVITSDHGNLEDLSTRSHTRAPVPLLGFGTAGEVVGQVRNLTGVAGVLEGMVEDGVSGPA